MEIYQIMWCQSHQKDQPHTENFTNLNYGLLKMNNATEIASRTKI